MTSSCLSLVSNETQSARSRTVLIADIRGKDISDADRLEIYVPPSETSWRGNMHNVDTCTGVNQPAGNGGATSRKLQDVLSRALPPLHRRAYRILRNTTDAEDAVQDALLAAYTHLNQFRGQSEMSTWLNTIVANCALMQLRRRLHHVHVSLDSRVGEGQEYSLSDTLVDSRPSPEDECCVSDLNARLTHFAGQLSPTLRRAIHLRHVENLSIQEIAQILGVPVGTVKTWLARARTKLMSLMRRAMRPRLRAA